MKIIKVNKVSDKLTQVLVEGEGHWLSVHKPKKKLGKKEGTEYSSDLVATQAEVDLLNKKTGLSKSLKKDKTGTIRTLENGDTIINFKAEGEYKDGNETPPIAVFDTNMQPFTEDLGNGSTIRLQINVVPYDNEFGSGVSARLVGVQVLKHVPYIKQGVDLELFDSIDTEPNTKSQPRLF